MTTVWKILPHFEQYEVSNDAEIRRIETQRIKAQTLHPHGHRLVNLSMAGKSSVRSVHNLVASAFLGERKSNEIVRFLDGDRANCRLSNLEIVPRAQHVPKEGDHKSKLSPTDVRRIRTLLEHGVPGRAIAKAFDVSEPTISLIKSGRKWPGQDDK
ncbi:HNH endonuclease [Qipengyuania sp. 902]|uniref:HNH endonuclease n=1 Tax=Qipengyuania sp. 902 TaxID=3417565 RepID=UPI003EC0D62A